MEDNLNFYFFLNQTKNNKKKNNGCDTAPGNLVY